MINTTEQAPNLTNNIIVNQHKRNNNNNKQRFPNLISILPPVIMRFHRRRQWRTWLLSLKFLRPIRRVRMGRSTPATIFVFHPWLRLAQRLLLLHNSLLLFLLPLQRQLLSRLLWHIIINSICRARRSWRPQRLRRLLRPLLSTITAAAATRLATAACIRPVMCRARARPHSCPLCRFIEKKQKTKKRIFLF